MEPLKVYLQRFREMEGEKSSMAARDKDASGVGFEGAASGGGGGGGGAGVYWQQPQQVYGGGGFHQMGVSGVGLGKGGPGSNMGRPR